MNEQFIDNIKLKFNDFKYDYIEPLFNEKAKRIA